MAVSDGLGRESPEDAPWRELGVRALAFAECLPQRGGELRRVPQWVRDLLRVTVDEVRAESTLAQHCYMAAEPHFRGWL